MDINANQLKKYLSLIKKEYSPSTYKRKLSSLRKFTEFLLLKNKLSQAEARSLFRVIDTERTKITRISAKFPDDEIERITHDEKRPKSLNSRTEDYTFEVKKLTPQGSSFPAILSIFIFFAANVFLLGRLNRSFTEKIGKLGKLQEPVSKTKEISTTLTVSGTLKDNYKIPYTTQQDLTFALYPSKTAQEPLYKTGICPTTPDINGYFTKTIGEDCGNPIPYLLFQTYPELYLGVALGFGEELKPRIPIKQINIASIPISPTLPPSPTPSTTPPLPSPTPPSPTTNNSSTE